MLLLSGLLAASGQFQKGPQHVAEHSSHDEQDNRNMGLDIHIITQIMPTISRIHERIDSRHKLPGNISGYCDRHLPNATLRESPEVPYTKGQFWQGCFDDQLSEGYSLPCIDVESAVNRQPKFRRNVLSRTTHLPSLCIFLAIGMDR